MWPSRPMPWKWCHILLLAVAFSGTLSANAEDRPLRRWAVVSSPELQQAGLSDLLTAELTKANGIELVEREQLEAATKELDLSTLLGSAQAAARLRLGRLLKADALLMLSVERTDSVPSLRVVISDCRYGARLMVAKHRYSPALKTETLTDISRLVDTIRNRFPGGIGRVIGVTHFVSKNLTHDHDHLQAGFACLIESELMRQPGVAVIETEEARAIAEELRLTGERLQGRPTPLVVNGEYEMVPQGAAAKAGIRLTVRLFDGNHAEDIQRAGLTPKQAAEFLSQELPRQIIQETGTPSPVAIPDVEQARLLEAQAAQFAKLGAYEHAIGLREAALLLTPDDLPLRLAVLSDYDAWHNRSLPEEFAFLRPLFSRLRSLDPEQWQDAYPTQWTGTHCAQYARVAAMVRHVCYVVHSRRLDLRRAHVAVGTVLWDARSLMRTGEVLLCQDIRELLDRFVWEIWRDLRIADSKNLRVQEFAKGRFLTTDPGSHDFVPSPVELYFRWTGQACSYVAFRAVRGYRSFEVEPNISWSPGSRHGGYWPVKAAVYFDDRNELDLLYRFLTEIARQDMPPIPFMARIVAASPPKAVLLNQRRYSSAGMHQFYVRLKKTDQPLNAFYGRCGQLMLDAEAQQTPESLNRLLAEARSLLAFYQEHGNSDAERQVFLDEGESFLSALQAVQGDLAKRLVDLENLRAGADARLPLLEESDPGSRLKFYPVGTVKPGWDGMAKCNATTDVRWSAFKVEVVRAKGATALLFES